MAAIGSKVRLLTLSPHLSITEYSESTTDFGRNVAIISTDIFSPLCPKRFDIIYPFK